MRAHFRAALVASVRSTTLAELASGVVSPLTTDAVVLARIWFADPVRGLLVLAGSAGCPAGGGTYSRLDGDFRCVAIGAGKIGQIAATGRPLVARSLRGDEEWLANPGWIARQGVRAFVGFPLTADDRVHGVLAIFARTPPTDADLDDLNLIADLTAIRAHDLQRQHAHSARDRSPIATPARIQADRAIVTRADLRAMERQTIEAALARTGGKVFGVDGAAALLGMKPTTLASRIKALDVLKTGGLDK